MNVAEQPVSAGIFPIDYGDRLRIGVILPSGNASVEPEFTAMAPPGVRFFFTRAALTGSTERELMGMAEGAGAAAKLLADARVDRIVFHCTGVTIFSPSIGEKIRSDIESLTGIPTFVTTKIAQAVRDLTLAWTFRSAALVWRARHSNRAQSPADGA